jgi:hypothetical protein
MGFAASDAAIATPVAAQLPFITMQMAHGPKLELPSVADRTNLPINLWIKDLLANSSPAEARFWIVIFICALNDRQHGSAPTAPSEQHHNKQKCAVN